MSKHLANKMIIKTKLVIQRSNVHNRQKTIGAHVRMETKTWLKYITAHNTLHNDTTAQRSWMPSERGRTPTNADWPETG